MGVTSFWRTTIGKKIVMAVTGVIMIVYLAGHLAGNLLVFAGPTRLDAYAALLRSKPVLLWAARAILLGAVALHVIAAYQLARASRDARPDRYAKLTPRSAILASRTMRVGGVAIAGFVIFHVLHLTTGTIEPVAFSQGHVYANVVGGFHIWWVATIYLIALAAVGLHLYHGTWAWSRTLRVSRPSPDPLH